MHGMDFAFQYFSSPDGPNCTVNCSIITLHIMLYTHIHIHTYKFIYLSAAVCNVQAAGSNIMLHAACVHY